MAETVGDIDTFDLIVMMGMDETACEIKPIIHDKCKIQCTQSVTHRLIFCQGSALSCLAYAKRAEKSMMREKRKCKCGKPPTECWRIIPV